jgi:hypothetical protein
MKPTRMIVGAAFVVAALGWSPASAESFTPAPGPGSLILDSATQNGYPATWRIDDLGSINAIRTSLRVHRLDYDPNKTPTFTVTLAGRDYKVVLNILSKNFKPPLTARLEHWVNGTFWEQHVFSSSLKLDEKMDVAIDWTVDGNVTVQAGSETKTYYLGAPVASLELSASVGEIEFIPFTIGHVRKPAQPIGPYILR